MTGQATRMERTQLRRRPRFEMELRYRAARFLVRSILQMICRLRVIGVERVPRRGNMILVTNHLHFLDPPVVMAAMPIRVHVLAAEKWEHNPIVGRLFRLLDAVFINRGTADIGALRKLQALLEDGAVLGMAPEGTRSPTGALQEGKGGAAYLASRTGATIVPVAAYGQERVFKALKRLRRAEVVVAIGEPFTLPPAEGPLRGSQLREMTTEIMVRIARLLPPAYRGVYAAICQDQESDL